MLTSKLVHALRRIACDLSDAAGRMESAWEGGGRTDPHLDQLSELCSAALLAVDNLLAANYRDQQRLP